MMFRHPWILAAILPALIGLIWLLRKELVRVDTRYQDEKKSIKQRKRARTWMFITRALMISLILVALATPVLQTEEFVDTDPRITVLKDTSQSMSVLDTQPADALIEQLRERVPVTIHEIGTGNQSQLGEDILAQLQEGRNFLLITDGQVTSGASLANVASFSASIDTTLNALSLEPNQAEASVAINGPDYVIEDTNTTWTITVDSTQGQQVPLTVRIDEQVVLEEQASGQVQLTRSFSKGEHTISAQIGSEDQYAQNNAFTKTVTATSKPRILYLTRQASGLQELTTTLYNADVRASIPDDLNEYYAVILDDMPLSALRGQQELITYAAQGNGLLVAGGENSYDYGAYKNSVLETVLPVRVGTGERERGGANIAIAIDMSGSTLGSVQNVDGEWVQASEQTQNVQKALAIDLIEQLNPSNRVGVVGFTYELPFQNQDQCSGACVVRRIEQLGNTKQELVDKIARLDITGGTALGLGMEAGLELLEGQSGSKNIIFISDGVSGAQDQQRALNAARTLAARGGRLYSVHVGTSDSGAAFLQQLAAAGNGVYFTADQKNRLTVLFGEPVDIDQGDAFDLVALNQHHFITQGIDPDATLFGYNQVIPKTGSQQLLTSSGGDPVLTTWYYGVGRVASLTAYNGDDYGQLLQDPNSLLISRTINWLIGDPQRKQDAYARVPDGRQGMPITINVTSPSAPSAQGISFERTTENQYTASLTQQETGVYDLLETRYAINYRKELENLGTSDALAEAVDLTGGRVFENPSVQEVITHAKELAQLKQNDEQTLRWPFILAALAVFVLEVVVRRIREIRKRT